jgi:uncharacterized membrane protein
MDPKRFVGGTLVGTITMYLVGYLIFDLSAASFYAANRSSDLARDPAILWATILGTASLAALMTLAVAHATKPLTVPGGAKVGAVVGFLVWFGVDFIRFGGTDYWTLTLTIVDPLLEIVRGGIAGAAIASVLAMMARSTAE